MFSLIFFTISISQSQTIILQIDETSRPHATQNLFWELFVPPFNILAAAVFYQFVFFFSFFCWASDYWQAQINIKQNIKLHRRMKITLVVHALKVKRWNNGTSVEGARDSCKQFSVLAWRPFAESLIHFHTCERTGIRDYIVTYTEHVRYKQSTETSWSLFFIRVTNKFVRFIQILATMRWNVILNPYYDVSIRNRDKVLHGIESVTMLYNIRSSEHQLSKTSTQIIHKLVWVCDVRVYKYCMWMLRMRAKERRTSARQPATHNLTLPIDGRPSQ